MKHKKFDTRKMVTTAMLCAILLMMSFTPLGYLNIGPLAISFNMIPVAIGAIALGPVGGMILGGMFGITSFLQCLGIGGTSAMGVMLFEISPVLAFVQRFVPRLLAGLLSGLVYWALERFGRLPAMVGGLLICYACGTLWFLQYSGGGLALVLLRCVVPYLIPDGIKIFLAWSLSRRIARHLT